MFVGKQNPTSVFFILPVAQAICFLKNSFIFDNYVIRMFNSKSKNMHYKCNVFDYKYLHLRCFLLNSNVSDNP